MTRLSKTTKAQITDLVIAYHCFNEANYRDYGERRDCGLCVWGDILLAAQDNLGVVMHERQLLVEMLANAKERWDQREKGIAA